MAKILNDKYYTPDDIVILCLSKLKEVLIKDGITPSRVIEPSAGNGAFSRKIKGCLAYDIHPESEGILKQDFLESDLGYEKNTVVITNPPFGRCLSLAQKFYKKAIHISDYIAFILPISQLNNNNAFYEFDLIESMDLGKQTYTDRELHCCFNIYRRPKNGFNSFKKTKLDCVKIIRQDSKNYINEWFDLRMCYWGNGSAGKILKDSETYSAEYKLQIKEPFKEKVIKVLESTRWIDELDKIAMLKIQQHHIISKLKKEIPEIY